MESALLRQRSRPAFRWLMAGLLLAAVISVFLAVSRALSDRCDPADLATPPPPSDQRYGVVAPGYRDPCQLKGALDKLHARWYYDAGSAPQELPPPYEKVLFLPAARGHPPLSRERLQETLRSSPGRYWIVGNEPNVPEMDNLSPEEYAQKYYYYHSAIKSLDPSAKILNAGLLNWDDTCTLCPGFTPGRQWVDSFRDAYRRFYGSEPPIDIWTIHAYDLDWTRLPQDNHEMEQRQIAAFREYLEALPEHRGKPMWVTEFGVNWGYDGVRWETKDGRPKGMPVGKFREDRLEAYTRNMLTWLEAAAGPLNIERWFFFAAYIPGYEGISLLDGYALGNRLTPSGRVYRDQAGRGR